MPRGKGLFKAITATKQHDDNKSANEDLGHCSGVRMKDVEQTAAAAAVKEEDETISRADDVSTVGNTSVDSSTRHEKENEDDSAPNKPKRLFMITGCRKKDAKREKSKETAHEGEPQACETDTTLQQKTKTDSLNDVQVVAIAKAAKRNSSGVEHPYEDPSELINNSTTPREEDNKNNSSKPKAKKKSRKNMKQMQAPHSQKASTESIKAAVKETSRSSVMSEHSIARTTFAFLVALLLSLIMFLAFYFLLQSHPVLAAVLAVLMYSVVFLTLGFLDGSRLKCLMLLFLPSVCSRGGKVSLYVLLLFFAIKGPLCDTIGNIKSVRGLIQCVNNEHSGELEATSTKAFHAAQHCTLDYPKNSTKAKSNQSMQASLACLKKSCFAVKEKFEWRCAMERPRISPKICSFARSLTCNNSKFLRNRKDCPKLNQTPCQKEWDEILGFLGEDDNDGCGFLEIIGMLLPLLILLLFNEAYNYEKNYLTHNDFHNYFLTGNFQCIDQSRSSCDREAVLPLRKVELRKHVRPAVCHLSDSEKTRLYGSLKTYLLFLLVVLFVILANYYTFTMFHIKSDKNSNVSNFFHSENKGLHKVLHKVQKIENVSSIGGNRTNNFTAPGNLFQLPDTNEDICSVTVQSVGSISKVIIPTLLSILLTIILLQAYIARLQWFICSRFYNDREKERVFYLYNKILEDRIVSVEKCQKQMKCYNRKLKTLKSLEPTRILAQQAKWLAKVFKFFHINLRKCIICNDSEKSSFKFCHGADCSGAYCLECSFDIDKKCLYCDTELKGSLSVKQDGDEQVLCSKESLV